MVRLLRIERAITWIAKSLTANRDANPTPEGVVDVILPNVDIFGTQRIPELQFAQIAGIPGGLEVSHTRVPDGFYRHYQTIEYFHDDPVVGGRGLRGGVIVATPAGLFPFVALKADSGVVANEHQVLRNFTVGPASRAAARIDVIAPGARLDITLLWIEIPVGEYLTGIV